MSGPHPPWVYDLVTAIENHEDVHAKGGPCFDAALASVPLETRREARAIAAYNGAKPTHATDTEHGPFRAIARAEMDAGRESRRRKLRGEIGSFLAWFNGDPDEKVIEKLGDQKLTVGHLRDLVAELWNSAGGDE